MYSDFVGDKCSPRNLLIDLMDKIHEADSYFLFYKICTIVNLYLTLVRIFNFARFQDGEASSPELEVLASADAKVDQLQQEVNDLSKKMDRVLAALESK